MEGGGFLFKASLKNNNIPELGTVTVEFPIPKAQYEETIRALNGIQSGAVVEQDCFVADIGTADCCRHWHGRLPCSGTVNWHDGKRG